MREYGCTLVHDAWPRLAVIRFALPEGGGAFDTPVPVPPGSISDGYFWGRRPYNLYRMLGPEGEILAHRFDAVTGVTLEGDVLSYRDLALDWWVLPGGRVIEEDRDELAAFVAAGMLSKRDGARAEQAAREVFARYRHIIDEAEAVERGARLA